MSDYTPTTEDVRRQYRAPAASVDLTDPQRDGEGFADYLGRVAGVDAFRHQQASFLVFDRWLAAHDREVAARALEEARDALMPPYNFELRPDGSEEPEAAKYAGIMHEVWQELSARAESLRTGGDTNTTNHEEKP